jgi:hypothetical protein
MEAEYAECMNQEIHIQFWLIKFRGRDHLGKPCTYYEENSQYWRIVQKCELNLLPRIWLNNNFVNSITNLWILQNHGLSCLYEHRLYCGVVQ